MKLKKRHALLTLLIPVIGLVAFLGIRSFVFSKIEKRIAHKIESLRADGFDVQYKALSFSWGSNVIEIDDLSLAKKDADTACVDHELISFKKIRGEGLRLLPLIFKNLLNFETLYVDAPRFTIGSDNPFASDSSAGAKRDFTLQVDHTYMNAATFTYRDSASCAVATRIGSNVTIDGMTIDFLADNPLAYQANWLILYNTKIERPKELYTFQISRVRMDFLNALLRVDSLAIRPTAGKMAFGQKHGFEIDRFQGMIAFLECQPFAFSLRDSARITAGMAEVQFFIKIFRDKHLPFRPEKKLLPLDKLAALPFALAIDSLKIRKSYVEYEEYAEGAEDPGSVYFDNLYASIYKINNRSATGTTHLAARADLQGKGRVDLRVTLPLEPNRRTQVEGTVTDFEIPEINSMLIPATNVKIESGKMEKLSFNFSFNSIRSDGTLELQYRDLKLVIFKDENNQKGDDAEKDNLKTFMMNTFIFRTNMDENVPEEKRTGTIAFVRDNNRSIFNFWVKSIVSGIKSAYNLDKIEAKKTEKEIKKEQRLTRREARKQRRAERKRERG